MIRSLRSLSRSSVLVAATAAAGSAGAVPIDIVNADFETVFQQGTTQPQAVNAGASSRNFGDTTLANGGQGGVRVTVPGWTGSNAGNFGQGVTRNATSDYAAGVNSSIKAYINGQNSISQSLGVTLQEGTYALSFEVGDPNSGNFSARDVPGVGALLADGVALTPTTSVTPRPTTGAAFVVYEYTFAIDAESADLGDSLAIRISRGTNAFDQINYDNVSLDFVAVPEPASLGLLAMGALAIVSRRRATGR